MAVVEKTQTAEEKAQAGESQKQRENDFAKKLIGTLDLPAGLADAIDDKEDRGKKVAKKVTTQVEESVEEETEESAEEEVAEETEESSDEESSEEVEEGEEEEGDEALSPEGKKAAQKRINEVVKENKRLKSALARKSDAKPDPAPAEEETSDPDQKTLNRLASQPDGIAKLKSLKREVMAAWKAEPDAKKADALIDLQEKIDATITTVPQRFQKVQLGHFQAAMRETAEVYGDKLTEKTVDSIHAIAVKIFKGSATLQASPTGQAEAWRLAQERFEDRKDLTAGKSKTVELQRQNNTLKKKVGLDVAVAKGNTDKSEGKRLFHKAKTGNNSDKTAYVKKAFNTDSLIPEEYRR